MISFSRVYSVEFDGLTVVLFSRDHLIAFKAATGFKPHRIIFYRYFFNRQNVEKWNLFEFVLPKIRLFNFAEMVFLKVNLKKYCCMS